MVRFLLDTNILSEPLRPQPCSRVMQQLASQSKELSTAAVVYHEMLFGCHRLPKSKRQQAIAAYLQEEVETKLMILPYDAEAANWHAVERARLMGGGKTPSFVDGQIAAIAVVNNLILVTNNTVNFVDFQSLQLQNWFDS
ncbi:type II toxin-antitoxin system VapC family toxin [Nodosilinea sp. E11]|uniref:type II toxin-antitoxin system VapC family toxin n=1 Tax=Nodosilinea sp. E11 TaxID=3037479 RepID=UPI0029347329|nr:type II toxin-antitoxin system VapC family toxin [Nodosilinea sp. E11]WOD41906.1 type II toxin-antitoxin system VapC family toxin [Nodosilinea sp. E11]